LSQLYVGNVNLKAEESSEPQEISVSVSVSGAYQDLYNFLSDLERLRRPLSFESSSFTLVKLSEGKEILTLSVSGKIPFLKK
jgi:Tfp pilus assembly protein PilO